jgi:hypothetical protein
MILKEDHLLIIILFETFIFIIQTNYAPSFSPDRVPSPSRLVYLQNEFGLFIYCHVAMSVS